MALVTADDLRPLLPGYTDAQLQAMLDRQTSWLEFYLGPLEGPIQQTLWPSRPGLDSPLRLFRRAELTDLLVTEDGTELLYGTDYRLLSRGGRIERIGQLWKGVAVYVEYTPADGGIIAPALINLCRIADLDPGAGRSSETIGDYSYTQDSRAAQDSRGMIVGELMRSVLQTGASTTWTPAGPHERVGS